MEEEERLWRTNLGNVRRRRLGEEERTLVEEKAARCRRAGRPPSPATYAELLV